jgi:DNA repair protein RadC
MVTTANEIAGRALVRGASALTEAELVALLLNRGERGDMALAKAHSLLEAIGGLRGLLSCDGDIAQAQELSLLQSAALLAAVELGRRLVRPPVASDCLDDPYAVAQYIHLHFGRPNQMVFGALFMDNHNKCVGQVDVFRGTHERVSVERRPILRAALRHNAYGLIVFQARTQGDPQASQADVAWAEQMRRSCELVDLQLLDYLVVAGERFTSVRRMKNW